MARPAHTEQQHQERCTFCCGSGRSIVQTDCDAFRDCGPCARCEGKGRVPTLCGEWQCPDAALVFVDPPQCAKHAHDFLADLARDAAKDPAAWGADYQAALGKFLARMPLASREEVQVLSSAIQHATSVAAEHAPLIEQARDLGTFGPVELDETIGRGIDAFFAAARSRQLANLRS